MRQSLDAGQRFVLGAHVGQHRQRRHGREGCLEPEGGLADTERHDAGQASQPALLGRLDRSLEIEPKALVGVKAPVLGLAKALVDQLIELAKVIGTGQIQVLGQVAEHVIVGRIPIQVVPPRSAAPADPGDLPVVGWTIDPVGGVPAAILQDVGKSGVKDRVPDLATAPRGFEQQFDGIENVLHDLGLLLRKAHHLVERQRLPRHGQDAQHGTHLAPPPLAPPPVLPVQVVEQARVGLVQAPGDLVEAGDRVGTRLDATEKQPQIEKVVLALVLDRARKFPGVDLVLAQRIPDRRLLELFADVTLHVRREIGRRVSLEIEGNHLRKVPHRLPGVAGRHNRAHLDRQIGHTGQDVGDGDATGIGQALLQAIDQQHDPLVWMPAAQIVQRLAHQAAKQIVGAAGDQVLDVDVDRLAAEHGADGLVGRDVHPLLPGQDLAILPAKVSGQLLAQAAGETTRVQPAGV